MHHFIELLLADLGLQLAVIAIEFVTVQAHILACHGRRTVDLLDQACDLRAHMGRGLRVAGGNVRLVQRNDVGVGEAVALG